MNSKSSGETTSTFFRRYEKNLFDIFRVVWNTHNPGRRLSPSARLSVDFYDPKPVISAKDQAETWGFAY